MSSAIQSVTQRLPWFVKDPAVAVIGEVSTEALRLLRDSRTLAQRVDTELRTIVVQLAGEEALQRTMSTTELTCKFTEMLPLADLRLELGGQAMPRIFSVQTPRIGHRLGWIYRQSSSNHQDHQWTISAWSQPSKLPA